MQNEKNTLFIKQLTNKQLEDFLDKLFPQSEGFEFSFDLKKKNKSSEEYFCVKVYHLGWETPLFVQLEEFNSTISQPSQWIQYLHQIFGDEYKQAYLDNCATIFDED